MTLQFTHVHSLPAEAGCETRVRIVQLLAFAAKQQHGNKSSKMHFRLRW